MGRAEGMSDFERLQVLERAREFAALLSAHPWGRREQVLEFIREHAPHRTREALAARLRPAIVMRAMPTLQVLALGASRIVGAPDVPEHFEWPRWYNNPLHFLAQIDLAQVAPFDVEKHLPRAGHLLFFVDPDDRAAWEGEVAHAALHDAPCVFYIQPGQPLERREMPRPFGPQLPPSLEPHALRFASEWQAPWLSEPFGNYQDLTEWRDWQEWEDVLREVQGFDHWQEHHLLGYGRAIQYEPELGREFHSASDQEADGALDESRLLLQIDAFYPDFELGESWTWPGGSADRAFFCIAREDLAARRFERAWLNLQCS